MAPSHKQLRINNKKLIFRNVSFSWPESEEVIINNCNFSILENGIWMIVGKNGSGKSTLFKLIQGLVLPTNGLIEYPSNVSMVFQNPDHQILMPTCASELILNIKDKMSKIDIHEKIQQTLSTVGLIGFDKRPVHTLSGGQKQRLAIASALINNSNFILMDEPTSFLDEFSQSNILKLVKNLSRSNYHPLTILWITHRLDELPYADNVASMKDGKLSPWQTPVNFKYS